MAGIPLDAQTVLEVASALTLGANPDRSIQDEKTRRLRDLCTAAREAIILNPMGAIVVVEIQDFLFIKAYLPHSGFTYAR